LTCAFVILIWGNAKTAFSEIAQRKSLTIKQVSSEAKINGDYFFLYQAISNLIKNAVEHATPNTEVSVGCIANGSTLAISVTNVGAAVPSYALDKIFDRFYSLPTPTGQKGSGIGLSFVK
jgi:two-component system, OmpR family, sensor histidine kinase CreC